MVYYLLCFIIFLVISGRTRLQHSISTKYKITQHVKKYKIMVIQYWTITQFKNKKKKHTNRRVIKNQTMSRGAECDSINPLLTLHNLNHSPFIYLFPKTVDIGIREGHKQEAPWKDGRGRGIGRKIDGYLKNKLGF